MKLTWSGDGLKARAMRGTGLTILSMGGANLIRLGSNLVLTRILFPEAFGLMALMQTFIQGLKMLSDTGVGPSIIRSDRGDDADFLNTAWTVQAMRGLLLWVILCALALPLAGIYDEPQLGQMLPVVGISVLISGFATTKIATANRHLALGRLTVVNLSAQLISAVIMIALAWVMQSVWALAIGGLIGAIITTGLQHVALPGLRNRFLWNRSAFTEIFHFGKFIFLSSALGFLINQGDRLVLGRYLELAEFGIYSIGMMLAGLPLMVSRSIVSTVIFPLYRQRPISESEANRRNLFRARRIVVAASLGMASVMAFIGAPLVDLLYDPRYAMAGPVVVLVSLALVPQIMISSYGPAFLAAGDSRSQFRLVLVGAILQVVFLLIGVLTAGIFGVALAPAAVNVLLIPLVRYFVRPYHAWDPVGDAALYLGGFALTGSACWLYWDRITLLIS